MVVWFSKNSAKNVLVPQEKIISGYFLPIIVPLCGMKVVGLTMRLAIFVAGRVFGFQATLSRLWTFIAHDLVSTLLCEGTKFEHHLLPFAASDCTFASIHEVQS
jgi:hypothetical protein